MNNKTNTTVGKYDTAAARWAGVGPYYAMFPVNFADNVVEKLTKPGDHILDPFAGRATSVFSAATKDRVATGIEINPVGWVYGATKLAPASKERVEKRITEIAELVDEKAAIEAEQLPEFFHHCFAKEVLEYLVAARTFLDWKNDAIDRTLMAFLLIHLHGRRSTSLSNQMRQSKAMSPSYSIQWWQERNLDPPQLDPVAFLTKKLSWRYSKGIPKDNPSEVLLGDSCKILDTLYVQVAQGKRELYKLLFTSPPYYSVTNYFVDQWLRLWMLGASDHPTKTGSKYKENGFGSKATYHELLSKVFEKAAKVMDPEGIIYIRTDARKFTFQTTMRVLELNFPDWKCKVFNEPYTRQTQTALFGDRELKPGDKDIILFGPMSEA